MWELRCAAKATRSARLPWGSVIGDGERFAINLEVGGRYLAATINQAEAQFLTFSGSMLGPVVFSQVLSAGVSYGLTYVLMTALPLAAGLSLLRHAAAQAPTQTPTQTPTA